MGTDGDDLVSLPLPPPPNPAARRQAIDAALRKFDGIADSPAPRKRPSLWQWASTHRGATGGLVTAALFAVIAIPAIQVALREGPQRELSERPGSAIVRADRDTQPPTVANEPARPATDQANAIETPAAPAQALPAEPAPAEERNESARADAKQTSGFVAPAPLIRIAPSPPPMAAAPPPPPPPLPPAVARQAPAEPEADASDVGNIIVTGSRVRRQNMDSASPVSVISSAEVQAEAFSGFLSRLQEALGGNDRRAVLRLVGLPLRVNYAGGARIYRSSRDIERDYDRIFTPAVREAARDLRSYDIVSRDGGKLRGSGRIWFGCGLRQCSSDETIRIREVEP